MAIKSLKYDDTLKVSVWLKDGRQYIGCDVTNNPCQESLVALMSKNGRVVCIPLHNVDKFEFYNEKV